MDKALADRMRALLAEYDREQAKPEASPRSDYEAFCRRAETRLGMEPNTLPASLTARQASVVLGWGYSSTKTAVRKRIIPTVAFGEVEKRVSVLALYEWLKNAGKEGGES